MGIWHIQDLHRDGPGRSAYRGATLEAWTAGGFACLVDERRLLGSPLAVSVSNAEAIFARIEQCSLAFGGAVEMRPSAPWAGYSLAEDLGIATLECLVDSVRRCGLGSSDAASDETASDESCIARALITIRLFEMMPRLRETVSPLTSAGVPAALEAAGLRESCCQGRFYVSRIL